MGQVMNNLKELVWIEDADSSVAQHEFVDYRVIPDHDSFGKFAVRYKDSSHRPATGFATVEDAKAWANDNYNGKMQSYVKPMPTWIDASKQLPQVDKDTQFICAYDSAIEPYVRVTTFSVEMGDFGLDHDDVLAWMPIPKFSTMQNNKGE